MIQLSENECEKIVKRATRGEKIVKIVKHTSEHFGDFLGFLGEYYRLNIKARLGNDDDEREKDFQFFVKSLPIKDLRSRRSLLINSGIFLKEVRIYDEIFPVLDNGINEDFWRPTTYLLREDLLVFDDLTLKNFKVLDENLPEMNRMEIEAILKSLANFHGCSLIYERNSKEKIGEKFAEILFETSVSENPWFHSGLETIRQVALKNKFIEASEADNFYENLFKTIKMMENSPFSVPHVLCHRDIWKNNLMFSKDPLHCVLIDFQTARYVPLSVDIVMAIYCNTSRDHYEKMSEHYVNFYYENLSTKLKNFNIKLSSVLSKENLMKSCEYQKNFALVYNCIIIMLTKAPHEFFQGFNEKDFRDFADGDRYRLVSIFLEKDLKFSKLLTDAVKALVEIFYRNRNKILDI